MQYTTNLARPSYPQLGRAKGTKRVDFKRKTGILKDVMKTYELTLFLTTQVPEDSLRAVLGKISEAVQKLGGIVEQQELQKKIILAYPVQQQREAYQALVRFVMNPKDVEAVQKQVQAQKEVLRSLVSVAPKRVVEIPTLAKASTKTAEVAEEEKMSIEDIDKKLEEIFKKEEV